MALNKDEQQRLAHTLAQTPGTARALALLALGCPGLPEVQAVAGVLVDRACQQAEVEAPTLDEFTALARPLIAALPEIRAFMEAHPPGTATPPAATDALRVRLIAGLMAQLGLAVPSLAPEGEGLSC